MTKKYIFVTLILLAVTLKPTFANTQTRPIPTMDGQVVYAQIQLDGITIDFNNPPIVLNDKVFVSTDEIFQRLDVQMYWFEDTKELIGYHDNTFIKFIVGTTDAYINGKHLTLDAMVTKRFGQFFIPIQTLADAFGLTYAYDQNTKVISLDFRENIYQYKKIGFTQYKKVTTSNWGISYFVPEYWETLDEYGTYGVVNDFETYTISPTVVPLDNNFNRNILSETLMNNLIYEYGNRLTLTETTLSVHNGFLCNEYHYDLETEEGPFKGLLYVFFENNIGYVFNAKYDAINSIYQGGDIFKEIIDTFQINKITIDQNAEHYIELNRFFEYQTHLDETIYSNMLSEGQIHFKGNLVQKEATPLLGFHIIIAKDDQRAEYYAPVLNGTFDANIPLPFGVGKHNISIYADLPSNAIEGASTTDLTLEEYIDEVISETGVYDTKDLAMRFSVVNTSDDDTQYLLPSTYIDFDTNAVYTKAGNITYDQISDYGKAKSIYRWIFENYDYLDHDSDENIATARTMITQSSGNDLEISFLYTGLLRALDIQARVVRGTNETDTHYWVEVYLNGKWILTDPTSDIIHRDNSSGIYYFDINSAAYLSTYDETELLPF